MKFQSPYCQEVFLAIQDVIHFNLLLPG